jgi:hypothetical protein
VWSSTTNLLYFLVEVTDDAFVDGFNLGVSSDIYNYDIIEVFIDEDKSGGLHVFDGTGDVGRELGTNAENAFAYHIYAAFPGEEQITTTCFAGDLDGTNWSDSRTVNYASHFPAFSLRKTGRTAVWEFSLIVYNDTYEENTKDAARSQLQIDKEMGLSLAYCDNDDPDEESKMRDNMFGSVYEPPPGNMHWMNADFFGRIKLVSDIPTGMNVGNGVRVNTMKFFPNPASSTSELLVDNLYRGEVTIRLFNILGQELYRKAASKTDRVFAHTLVADQFPPGFYFIQTQMGQSVYNEKLIIIPGK